jgi:hypothetical protein
MPKHQAELILKPSRKLLLSLERGELFWLLQQVLLAPPGSSWVLLAPLLESLDLKPARIQPDYDHSYYFVSTFIGEHLGHHAKFLHASTMRNVRQRVH